MGRGCLVAAAGSQPPGFAHLGSIGIQIGGLGPMAPNRRGEIAKLAFKSMIVANMATWLTAAICGVIF